MIGFPRHTSGQSRSFICASNSTKSFENIRSSVNFCLRSASSISALANNGLQLSASRLKAHSGNFGSDASNVSMLSATNLANLRHSSV